MNNCRIRYTLLLMLLGVTLVWAQSTDDELVIDEPTENDLYVASRVVEVRSQVDGDLVAA